jgi:hypothetical protein
MVKTSLMARSKNLETALSIVSQDTLATENTVFKSRQAAPPKQRVFSGKCSHCMEHLSRSSLYKHRQRLRMSGNQFCGLREQNKDCK